MALIRFGGMGGEIRGSIAGQTYSRNRAGAYVRNRTKPINPSTDRQSTWRAKFASIMVAYSNLSSSLKNQWNEAAQTFTWLNKLGEPFTPSGQQLYMSCQANLLSANQSISTVVPDGNIDTAPSITEFDASGEVTAGAQTTLELTGLVTSLNSAYAVVEASARVATQNLSNNTTFKQVAQDELMTASINFLTRYNEIYGSQAAVGDVIHVRIKAISAVGIAGPWTYGTIVNVAAT